MQIIAFLYVLEMAVKGLQKIGVNQYCEGRDEYAGLCLPFLLPCPLPGRLVF